MANILLLEPSYRNKYPPLGLMKLAYYHKHVRKDSLVKFAKGQLKENDGTLWDRIYVTTLFTFEWNEIVKTINYAISLVDDKSKVYIGGIAATLLAEEFRQLFPGINVIEGLLNKPGKIGFEDEDKIDFLPPDYSILDEEQYKYGAANAYFAYTTRGCGMNCSFCAVKILEPEYIPHVKIKESIEEVIKNYGPKKDLILMDNNVLKSQNLAEIVGEIEELGFGKGAKYKNPITQNIVHRVVDFNQGLDAKLLTEEKANLLARLELKPVRIAFDHIEDRDSYITAIERCARAGLREFSNYILYNADETTGKGGKYPPDTPEDLYNRIFENFDLQDRLSEDPQVGEKISIYSFPMRYIPLNSHDRSYVGPCWNQKYLRAVRVMLTPSQGKGVSSGPFYKAAFGKDINEYRMTLLMPDHIIASRGFFVEKKDESPEQRVIRYKKWKQRRKLLKSWISLYKSIKNNKNIGEDYFIELIKDNKFSYEIFKNIKGKRCKQIYLFYFSSSRFLDFLSEIDNDNDAKFVFDYCTKENPLFLERIIDFIKSTKILYGKLSGYIKIFGYRDIEDILKNFAIPAQFNTLKITNKENVIEAELDIPEQNKYFDQNNIFSEWEKAYESIDNKSQFINYVKLNNINLDIYKSILNFKYKKLYLFYLSEHLILELLDSVNYEQEITMLYDFFTTEAPTFYRKLAYFIYSKGPNSNIKISGFIKAFGYHGVNSILDLWFSDPTRTDTILNLFEKEFLRLRFAYTDIVILRAVKEYLELQVFKDEEIPLIKEMVMKRNFYELRLKMEGLFKEYERKYLDAAPDDFTIEAWKKAASARLEEVYYQLFQQTLNFNDVSGHQNKVK